MDEGRWITTKTGHRVFIKNTNAYMNEKIRQSKNKTKEYELYHGSRNNFDSFDDKYIGARSLGGLSYGKGHYFLADKSDTYGREGYKVKVKLKNPFVVQESKWSAELTKMGYDWFDFSRPDPSDFLSQRGYDSTILTNETNGIQEVIIYTNSDNKIKIVDKFKNY